MRLSRSMVFPAVLVMLIGCTADEPDEAAVGGALPRPAQSAGADTGTAAPPPTDSQPMATAATLPTGVAPVLATTEGEKPGVTINLTQLKRDRGNTMTLRFTLINNGSEELNIGGHWLGDEKVQGDYYGVGGVHLLDPVNNQKIFVVRDADRACVCSSDVDAIPAGGTANLWAKFPAPAAGVQAVTVVVPHFIPMDDVPIQL